MFSSIIPKSILYSPKKDIKENMNDLSYYGKYLRRRSSKERSTIKNRYSTRKTPSKNMSYSCK